MSTLIQENGKTREEMDVENQVNQNNVPRQGPVAANNRPEEEKKGDNDGPLSSDDNDSEV